MNYAEIGDDEEFRASIAAFIAAEAPPAVVNRWENEMTFPAELYRKMAELGWIGIALPEEHGGAGAGPIDVCVLGEELARRGGYEINTLVGMSVFGGLTVLEHGSPEQHARYLPRLAAGGLRFCVAYTEPDTGSDAASIQTRAVPDGDGGFVLNGQKVFISAASHPDTVMQVTVRTDPDLPRHKGMSVLLVPNDASGVEIQRLPAMGRNMLGFNTVHFDDVHVPAEDVLGEVNGGWSVLMSGLEYERSFVSSGYVGAAQGVVDEALEYALTREQFGQPIGSFQSIAHMLADMQTKVDAARGLLYHAVTLLANGRHCARQVSEAKLFGSETFVEVANQGVQIMGAHGYVLESSMQRHLRDARSTTIAAGTSQIHRTIIARNLGLRVR